MRTTDKLPLQKQFIGQLNKNLYLKIISTFSNFNLIFLEK